MRRALSRKAAKKFVREKRAALPRNERKLLIKSLSERAFKDSPMAAFERHLIQRPKIIVPQVEIQAAGVPQCDPNERRTPGGIILP